MDEERLHHARITPTKAAASFSQNLPASSRPRSASTSRKSSRPFRPPSSTTASPTEPARSSPIFTLPGSANLYATAIGVIDSSQEGYFCDVLFYYDDPHSIYDYWPKNVWAAIDAHQVLPGMSELQAQMSIGHNQHTDSGSEGNRTVTYDQAGKKWTITFVNNHATEIESK